VCAKTQRFGVEQRALVARDARVPRRFVSVISSVHGVVGVSAFSNYQILFFYLSERNRGLGTPLVSSRKVRKWVGVCVCERARDDLLFRHTHMNCALSSSLQMNVSEDDSVLVSLDMSTALSGSLAHQKMYHFDGGDHAPPLYAKECFFGAEDHVDGVLDANHHPHYQRAPHSSAFGAHIVEPLSSYALRDDLQQESIREHVDGHTAPDARSLPHSSSFVSAETRDQVLVLGSPAGGARDADIASLFRSAICTSPRTRFAPEPEHLRMFNFSDSERGNEASVRATSPPRVPARAKSAPAAPAPPTSRKKRRKSKKKIRSVQPTPVVANGTLAGGLDSRLKRAKVIIPTGVWRAREELRAKHLEEATLEKQRREAKDEELRREEEARAEKARKAQLALAQKKILACNGGVLVFDAGEESFEYENMNFAAPAKLLAAAGETTSDLAPVARRNLLVYDVRRDLEHVEEYRVAAPDAGQIPVVFFDDKGEPRSEEAHASSDSDSDSSDDDDDDDDDLPYHDVAQNGAVVEGGEEAAPPLSTVAEFDRTGKRIDCYTEGVYTFAAHSAAAFPATSKMAR